MAELRSVNGYGPRCGCGGESVLHWRTGRIISPETSIFLCSSCAERAIRNFMSDRSAQPSYWPGDEDRDEPYEVPPGSWVAEAAEERAKR